MLMIRNVLINEYNVIYIKCTGYDVTHSSMMNNYGGHMHTSVGFIRMYSDDPNIHYMNM